MGETDSRRRRPARVRRVVAGIVAAGSLLAGCALGAGQPDTDPLPELPAVPEENAGPAPAEPTQQESRSPGRGVKKQPKRRERPKRPGRPERPPERPNIVLVLTDDQALVDLEVMPQTRRLLGDRGVTFATAISQYPLCCPARATLLTGQLAHNHGIMGNEPPWGSYDALDESATLPVWLQEAGYRTGIVGKYLNFYPRPGELTYVPPGWDDWRVPVERAYHYRDYVVNEDGRLVRHTQYQTTWTEETVNELIRDYAEEDDPFFVWAGFLAPHFGGPIESGDPIRTHGSEGAPTPAVADRYRDTDTTPLPLTPAVTEEDLEDKAPYLRRRPALDLEQVEEAYRQRRESLRSVDDAVASIVRTLKRTGELDDTVIVFTSDNGHTLGAHGLQQKIYGYEESIRVPLLMAGPGIPQGVRRDQLVSLTDLPATFLDLAGAETGVEQDGVSLVPLAESQHRGRGRHLLLEAGGWPFPDEDRLYTGVRTGDGRVVLRWYDGWVETYDLAEDPYQLDGTASPEELEWRDELVAELDELETCAGDACS